MLDNHKKGNDLPAVVFLFTALVLFYYPVVFNGDVIAPHNMGEWYPWKDAYGVAPKDNYSYYAMNDVLNWYYTTHHFIKENFSFNNLWAWDPYRGCGHMLTYIPPAPYFSTFLFLLDEKTGMTASALLLMLLSGISLFYFLREMELGDAASVFGAVAYMLNSYSLAYSGFLHELTVATLIPPVLLFSERALKRPRYIYIVPGTLVTTFLAYNGKPQITVHLIYLLLFYTMFKLSTFHGQQRREAVKKGLVILGASGALTALIYLPQAAVLIELARHSDRLSKTFDFFAQSKFPIKYLVTLVSWDFFGKPMGPDFWGAGFMHKFVDSYTGIIPITMLFVAFFERRKGQTYFWLGTLAVALFIVLNNAFYRLFVDYVPGFSMSRNRPTEIVIFSIIILASIGFDNLLKYRERILARSIFLPLLVIACLLLVVAAVLYWTPAMDAVLPHLDGVTRPQLSGAMRSAMYTLAMAVLCAAAVLLYLTDKLKRRVFQGVIISLVLIDIFVVNRELRYVQAPSDLYRMTGGIELLKDDKSIFRVIRFGNEELLPPNTLEVFNIQDAQVYDSILNKDYVAYMKNIEPDIVSLDNRIIGSLKRKESLDLPAFKLLNVKYMLSMQDITITGWKLVYNKEMKIYQNLNLVPRACMVHEATTVNDRGSILAALKDNGFRPDSSVFLEDVAPVGLTLGKHVAGDHVKVTRYSSKFVDMEVTAGSDGFLLLTDTYWPDWKAYVDGAETKIYKADYLFRAVAVKAGEHRIRFAFQPDWLNKYYYIAGTVIAALVLFVALYAVRALPKKPGRA